MGSIYKKVYGKKGVTTNLRDLKGVLKYNKEALRKALYGKRMKKVKKLTNA